MDSFKNKFKCSCIPHRPQHNVPPIRPQQTTPATLQNVPPVEHPPSPSFDIKIPITVQSVAEQSQTTPATLQNVPPVEPPPSRIPITVPSVAKQTTPAIESSHQLSPNLNPNLQNVPPPIGNTSHICDCVDKFVYSGIPIEVFLSLLKKTLLDTQKPRRIRLNNPRVREFIVDVDGGVELMECVGFEFTEARGEMWATLDGLKEDQIDLIEKVISYMEGKPKLCEMKKKEKVTLERCPLNSCSETWLSFLSPFSSNGERPTSNGDFFSDNRRKFKLCALLVLGICIIISELVKPNAEFFATLIELGAMLIPIISVVVSAYNHNCYGHLLFHVLDSNCELLEGVFSISKFSMNVMPVLLGEDVGMEHQNLFRRRWTVILSSAVVTLCIIHLVILILEYSIGGEVHLSPYEEGIPSSASGRFQLPMDTPSYAHMMYDEMTDIRHQLTAMDVRARAEYATAAEYRERHGTFMANVLSVLGCRSSSHATQ